MEYDGKLYFSPSSSPENAFVIDGKSYSVAVSAAISQSIIKELLTHLISASEILGKDENFRQQLQRVLAHLGELRIGPDGRLL